MRRYLSSKTPNYVMSRLKLMHHLIDSGHAWGKNSITQKQARMAGTAILPRRYGSNRGPRITVLILLPSTAMLTNGIRWRNGGTNWLCGG